MIQDSILFWSISVNELFEKLQSSQQGLTTDEANKRAIDYGSNLLKPEKSSSRLSIFISQFKSPIIILLLITAILSFFLQDPTDSIIIIIIVFASGMLGFWEENKATSAIEDLLAIVHIKSTILRDGQTVEILTEEIVPGDIIIFSAGDIVPADCYILESKDLFVNESTLTGETFPIEKKTLILKEETQLSKRVNSLFMGTNIISGKAKALVITTGKNTEFGKISERLKLRAPETEFDHGVRKFGYFLMQLTLILVITIFVVNVFFSRPILDSFLFSLALAVGMTPQLLPAIISVNLAKGAKKMADQKVIVKRLNSIENFGSMNILCSDKTGTLTEGVMKLYSSIDISNKENEKVFLYGYLNASYQTGYFNPIDEAIHKIDKLNISNYLKLDEIPYDFIRKRLSILISKETENILITKGAVPNILEVCSLAEISDGKIVDINEVKNQITQIFEDYSSKGFRLLGVAYKNLNSIQLITKEHEINMIFLGFLTLYDPIKTDAIEILNDLKNLGVTLKIITGDNKLIANYVGQQIGTPNPKILTGLELREISDESLIKLVNDIDLFAEVEPNQKERIILALKKAGNVVGYMGDGINDASALHAADVGISVDTAVDVAKDAADIILLDKDLKVLVQGVQEGRKTFANTMKYVFVNTSASFGNMFSMAGASLFLPFLPMLPKQILLTNLVTDFPDMSLATDNVDREQIERPKRWNIKFIRRFMITFGILSSFFDFLTFAILLFLVHTTPEQFRTGWFFISVISELMIMLVLRTQKNLFKSRPSLYLLLASFIAVGVLFIFLYSPLNVFMSFTPLSFSLILILIGINLLYIFTNEFAKKIFYKFVQY